MPYLTLLDSIFHGIDISFVLDNDQHQLSPISKYDDAIVTAAAAAAAGTTNKMKIIQEDHEKDAKIKSIVSVEFQFTSQRRLFFFKDGDKDDWTESCVTNVIFLYRRYDNDSSYIFFLSFTKSADTSR